MPSPFGLIAPSSFISIFKPLVELSTLTGPRVEAKVIFDFIESKSDWLIFAPGAVISTLIGWVETCGSYFVAWVRILNLTLVGFVPSNIFLSSFVEPSFAIT